MNETQEQKQPEIRNADEIKRQKRNQQRKAREQALRDMGLVKVRGNLGGNYWE